MARKVSKKTLDKYKLVIDQWFINGFNGAEAYRKFYPRNKSPRDGFDKIHTLSYVEKYISEKHQVAQKILGTTHENILNEFKRWAYSDITQTILLSPDQIKELPEEVRRLITRFKRTKKDFRDGKGKIYLSEDVIELHFVSKEKAMDMICKHVAFYSPIQIKINNEDIPLFIDDPLAKPE